MKLLSIAIPCYNSAAYMKKCIESLLPGVEDVEILVVNDGSTDSTLKLCRRENFHYLDLPIQHASDEVLRRMGRKTTKQQIREVVCKLRREIENWC